MVDHPVASFDTVHNADGSATFSCNGFVVVGAVNGPIEVPRKDELPEEAAIEVILRPAVGVGSQETRSAGPNPRANEPFQRSKSATWNPSCRELCAELSWSTTFHGRSSK